MDFIIKLLKSKDSIIKKFYDSIMVVIDKLIKYIYLYYLKKLLTQNS